MMPISFKSTILVILACLSPVLCFAQSDMLALSSGTVPPGGTASLSLSLTSTSGNQPAALQWTFTYSPTAITNISAVATNDDNTAGKTLSCTAAAGTYTCFLTGITSTGLNANPIPNVVIATVSATISPTASSAPIGITNAMAVAPSGAPISAGGTGGTISVSVPITVTSLSCNPMAVTSSASTTCTVGVSQAVSVNTAVALSDNNALLTIPASVTVLAGASSGTFIATAGNLPSNQSATITASLNGSLQSTTLSLIDPVVVTSLVCNPASVNSSSSSACTITLNEPAPTGGGAVAISSNNASLTVPASVVVPASSSAATFTANTGAITTNQSATITAVLNGASQAATLNLVAPAVTGLTCSPTSINSGSSTTCTITLNQVAPAGGSVVTLSDNGSYVTEPASVTVAAGVSSGTFTGTVGTVTTTQSATVTATLNSSSQTASLTLVAPMLVTGLVCNPASVNSGSSTTCSVTLNQAAPAGGSVVTLSDNSSYLTVPASVTVAASATSGSFTATVGTLTTTQSATVTATLNTSSQTASLTLVAPMLITSLICNPASVNAGSSATCSVTLNQAAPAGGSVVALSDSSSYLTVPASVTVAANASSASFTATVGTLITTQSATVTATLNSSSLAASLTLVSPYMVSALSCDGTTLNAGASANCTLTLSVQAPAGGITVPVSSSTPDLIVPASIVLPAGASSAGFVATATMEPPDGGTTEAASLNAALNGASQSAAFTLILCPCSVWPSTAVPVNPATTSKQGIEVGMQFTSSVAGYVTGVRFYKGTTNTGTHVGNLWSATGTNLGKVTFTNETPSGWQIAYFASPVAITANTTYVISYHTTSGHNAADNGYFTNAVSNPPLGALTDGQNGPNGVYKSGSSGFPTAGGSATNYWVDAIFNTAPTVGTALPVSVWAPTVTPTNTGVTSSTAQELGLTFLSNLPGYITGLRFYKSSKNTGTHVGALWTSTGTQLATVTFTNESSTGWQQANFAAPVAINANTPYVISYWAPKGHYANDMGYFATTGVTNQALYAPPNGQYGPNGSYSTSQAFPTGSSNSNNYWVDVVFTTAIQ